MKKETIERGDKLTDLLAEFNVILGGFGNGVSGYIKREDSNNVVYPKDYLRFGGLERQWLERIKMKHPVKQNKEILPKAFTATPISE